MSKTITTKKQPLVAIIGYTGGVGKCLLKAMEKINLKPYALCRSKTMKFCFDENENDENDENIQEDEPVNYDKLSKKLLLQSKNNKYNNYIPIIADVTASTTLQEKYYNNWLKLGINIVTANKGIFANDEKIYNDLLLTTKHADNGQIKHETTVGAGLPIISTIKSLKNSSHNIIKIEGILSGTLAYVLGEVAGNKTTLSEAVIKAKKLGYTEPDPRDDLNGIDVARKAIILGRICDMKNLNINKLNIESLVPSDIDKDKITNVNEFLNLLSNYDDEFAKRIYNIENQKGKDGEDGDDNDNEKYRMHYGASINVIDNTIKVGLMSCNSKHPFNNTAGSDNMISIKTNYYYDRPMIIQGAGAGGDVTATGVLADIMSLV